MEQHINTILVWDLLSDDLSGGPLDKEWAAADKAYQEQNISEFRRLIGDLFTGAKAQKAAASNYKARSRWDRAANELQNILSELKEN